MVLGSGACRTTIVQLVANRPASINNLNIQKMMIRKSTQADWERIIEIYNEAIETGYSTAEISPVSVDSRSGWLHGHDGADYPIYVAEIDEEIRGWCSLSPYRPGRMALRRTVEISYYVATEFWRQGIGSALLEYTIREAQVLGYKTLFGILLDTNEASIKLLEKYGFERWGHLPDIAEFQGRECGHIYLGKRIA